MKCPKCRVVNPAGATECDNCGVQFAHLKRQQEPEKQKGPDICAWDDHGSRCPSRGVMSDTTTGGGKWYCREHWDRVAKRDAQVVGNAVPPYVQSIAAKEWHAAMAKHRAEGGYSILYPNAKPGLPNPMPAREREPGEDWDEDEDAFMLADQA